MNPPVVVHHCSVGLFKEISTARLPKYNLGNKVQKHYSSCDECTFSDSTFTTGTLSKDI